VKVSEFRANRKHKIENSPFGNTCVLRYPITLATARTYRSAATIGYVHSNSGFLLGHKFKSQEVIATPSPWKHTSFTDPSIAYIYLPDRYAC